MKCKIITKHGGMPDKNFNRRQLMLGIKTEMEHTKSRCLAKQIAKDHLVEKMNYYTMLRRMKL
jgi:hypothetical protein